MENNEHNEVNERRRFFRIEDHVHLHYEVLEADELSKRIDMLEKGVVGQFSVMSGLSAITSEMTAVLRQIENRDPDIAYYLGALDKKIDLLGKSILIDAAEIKEKAALPANISASGIAFHSREKLEVGSTLELKMLLMPSFAGVLTYGDVISCEKLDGNDSDYDYLVRIDFSHIRDEDRDVLIRHVIRKEGDMLRERRVARQSGQDSDTSS